MLPREVFFTLPLRFDIERMGMRSPLASNSSKSSSSSSMQMALVFLNIGRGPRLLSKRRFYFQLLHFRFLSCWTIMYIMHKTCCHPTLAHPGCIGGSGGAVLLLPSSNSTDLALVLESPNAMEARLLSRFFPRNQQNHNHNHSKLGYLISA